MGDACVMSESRISVCMLVLNEGQHVEQALRSVIHLVDEVLVMDGGSADGTVEVLRAFGDKVHVQVCPQKGKDYSGDWQQELRRQSLLNRATGDWVLTLDGDEVLGDGFADLLMQVRKNGIPSETVAFSFRRLEYAPDLRHAFLPVDVQMAHPRLVKNGTSTWLTGADLHMTQRDLLTGESLGRTPEPRCIRSPLLLHHLHRAQWIGKSWQKKMRPGERGAWPMRRSSRLGKGKWAIEPVGDLICDQITHLSRNQMQVLRDQLGVTSKYCEMCEPQICFQETPAGLVKSLEAVVGRLPHPVLFVEVGLGSLDLSGALTAISGGGVVGLSPSRSAGSPGGCLFGDDWHHVKYVPEVQGADWDRYLALSGTAKAATPQLEDQAIDLLVINDSWSFSTLGGLEWLAPKLAPWAAVMAVGERHQQLASQLQSKLAYTSRTEFSAYTLLEANGTPEG